MAAFAEKIARNLKMVNAAVNPGQVGYVIFYVTNRCNFRCEFCFYYAEIEKGRKPNELSLEEIDRIARSTGSLLQLSLTGGEPFVRKEFAEITEIFIRHTGVRFITIPTNASMPDRMMRYLERVLPAHPDTYFRLAFSIDGIGDEHDINRSMPGSYAKLVESYKRVSPLRKRFSNLVLDSNSVFTANSAERMLSILQHLSQAFAFDNHTVTYVRGDIKDPGLKARHEAEYRKINAFLASLERTKEKRFLYPLYRGVRDTAWDNLMATVFEDKFVTPCVAGRKLIVIGETGEVKPCEILDKSLGNLRDFDFDVQKLMATKRVHDVADWIVDTKCKCSFECALAANVTWNWSQYPRLATAALRNFGRRPADVETSPSSVGTGHDLPAPVLTRQHPRT